MEEDFLCDNLVAVHSPKRGREEELAPHLMVKSSSQVKRLRKSKTHAPIEKDKTRGRYACLGHRMKHKRCPLDCPERRPKPNQELEPSLVQVKKEVMGNNNNKPRISRGNIGIVTKKHVLQLEEKNHVSHQVVQSTTPSSEKDIPNWDSVEWEGLGWDAEHVCLKETEAWMDLKSSSHWEESKSQVLASEDTKPMDDLTKYEEDEIIDSWLNDDGFGNAAQDYESAERNEGREGNVSETSSEGDTSSHCTNIDRVMETIPKVLVTRDMLERWLHDPYFNSLVQGCFVRVMVGEYMENPIYRLAHIHEVHDNFFSNNNMSQMQNSNKLLSLQVGNNSKLFPIAAISNQPPTESDLRKWQEEIEKSHVALNPVQFQQKQGVLQYLAMKYQNFLVVFKIGRAHV